MKSRESRLASLNRIVLVGQLTADPDSRSTVDGLAVTKFRLAVKRPQGEGASGTDFIDIVTWRQLAELGAQVLKKGKQVLVEGRIQNRSYDNQAGQRIWTTEIIASNLVPLDQAPVAINQDEEVVDDESLAGDLPF